MGNGSRITRRGFCLWNIQTGPFAASRADFVPSFPPLYHKFPRSRSRSEKFLKSSAFWSGKEERKSFFWGSTGFVYGILWIWNGFWSDLLVKSSSGWGSVKPGSKSFSGPGTEWWSEAPQIGDLGHLCYSLVSCLSFGKACVRRCRASQQRCTRWCRSP